MMGDTEMFPLDVCFWFCSRNAYCRKPDVYFGLVYIQETFVMKDPRWETYRSQQTPAKKKTSYWWVAAAILILFGCNSVLSKEK